MLTDNYHPLTGEGLAARVRSPVGIFSAREPAVSDREAVMMLDDPNRGMPAGMPVWLVIEELLVEGLGRGHIRLLCVPGNHALLTRTDFV